jgi:chromosome segregation ATPase
MANPVFENALTTMRQVVDTVEREVQRYSMLDQRIEGTQQRLEALRVQERELQQVLNELAPSIARSRQEIEKADADAQKIKRDSEFAAAKIVADARNQARVIAAEAEKEAAAHLESAKNQAAPFSRQTEEAKRELAAINEQIAAAKYALAQIKQRAAEFAAA